MHLRHRENPGEWRHGDAMTERPGFFARPEEEREILRRKTFGVDALTPEEAALELEQLDHDFYLFTNLATGEDNVLCRIDGERYALLQPSSVRAYEPVGDGIELGARASERADDAAGHRTAHPDARSLRLPPGPGHRSRPSPVPAPRRSLRSDHCGTCGTLRLAVRVVHHNASGPRG